MEELVVKDADKRESLYLLLMEDKVEACLVRV